MKTFQNSLLNLGLKKKGLFGWYSWSVSFCHSVMRIQLSFHMYMHKGVSVNFIVVVVPGALGNEHN
jgi:hypothetical protein